MTTITLPLPPDSLRTNNRMGRHWGTLNKEKKAYKLACALAVRAARLTDDDNGRYPAHLTLTVYLGKGQRLDPSDAGTFAKAAIDVLVEERVFRGDNSTYINPFTARVERDAHNPRLELSWE